MSLQVTDISQIQIDKLANDTFVNSFRNSVNELINNDQSLVNNGNFSPKIWEAKWLLDSSSPGYNQGQAVWINTDSPQSLINTRYNTVLKYVKLLHNSEYERIDKNNQRELNKFLIKAIDGWTDKKTYFFYVGDMTKPAQIRISLKNDNKETPDKDSWKDFYIKNDEDENKKKLLSCLDDILDTGLSNHIANYHLSSISIEELNQFVHKDISVDLDTMNIQEFYDHNYCNKMDGFDYVLKSQYKTSGNEKQWYRLWRSGYLECGGVIAVHGGQLNNISLKKLFTDPVPLYNYNMGVNGYEYGFGSFMGKNVSTTINIKNRYSVSVTPLFINISDNLPYQNEKPECDKNITYQCVDITNLENDGFSVFVKNGDVTYISYQTYGYSIIN